MNSIKKFVKKIIASSLIFQASILWAFPASTNFQLRSFEFGGGGGTVSSTNYSAEGTVGETGGEMSSTNFQAGSGLIFVQQANTPGVPTLSNDNNWYDKLHIIINQSNNPSDTTYAIAISDDNFVTTEYVQNDNTVGPTLGIEDFQTYAQWGSATGEDIIGLTPGTTYTVKVKARQGNYTESPYGPTASAATINPTLTFDIDIGGDSDPGNTNPPYQIAVGTLTAGVVTTATDRVWIDLDTNANSGGYVYIYDQYGGLRSTNANYTIASGSNDLSGVSEGFGLQAASVAQTSGGPLAKVSPYNGASNNVGIVNTTIREIFSSTASPIVGGRGSIALKSKVGTITPASADYTDTLTFIASATF